MNIQSSTSEFHIDFPISPAWFRTIRGTVMTACSHAGFDEHSAGRIAMATDEALSNIYLHGYRGDSTGRVQLHLRTICDTVPRIEIRIEDKALQVDMDSLEPRNLEKVQPGGFGIFLIRTIMDEAIWEQMDAGGMRLTMSKAYNAMVSGTCQTTEDANDKL